MIKLENVSSVLFFVKIANLLIIVGSVLIILLKISMEVALLV
jgi:hypothetical protein